MDHLTDAELLEGLQEAATCMPAATLEVLKEIGLTRLAPVLARFIRIASGTKH
jgi:hypothetical protein